MTTAEARVLKSPNFGFLARYDATLAAVAARAEAHLAANPLITLTKLGQLGKFVAQYLVARTGVFADIDEPLTELLARLRLEGAGPREVIHLLHDLRRVSNTAAHQHQGDPPDEPASVTWRRSGVSTAAPALGQGARVA